MAAREWQVPTLDPVLDPAIPFEDLRHHDFWSRWAADYEADYSRTHPPTGVADWLSPRPPRPTRRWWQVWKREGLVGSNRP